MDRYQLKPIEVEAAFFDGSEASAKAALTRFFPDVQGAHEGGRFAGLTLRGPRGMITVRGGVWIVRSPFTGVVAFPPDQFAEAFQRVAG